MLPAGVTANTGVVLNDGLISFLARMRSALDPSVPMHVNSAIRTVTSQAEAMWVKLQADPSGNGLLSLYGTKAVSVIAAAKAAGIAGMVQSLNSSLNSGVVFSKHMTGDALDIRILGLSSGQVAALQQAAYAAGARETILETVPPHLHIEGLSQTGLMAWTPTTTSMGTFAKKAVPAAGAILLGAMLIGVTMWWRRRRSVRLLAGSTEGSDD